MMVINETLQKGRIVQFKIFIKKIFPSYEYMCVTPHYTWIKNKRILLPVVWIYRWFRGIKKLKSRIGFLKSSFVKKEKIEKREDMYRQWGL